MRSGPTLSSSTVPASSSERRLPGSRNRPCGNLGAIRKGTLTASAPGQDAGR